MGIFSKKKNEQCSECNEKFQNHNELLDHGQIVHNRIIIKCPICNESFLHNQSRIEHTKTHKVNLIWQIVSGIIPFFSIIAVYDIRKFTRMFILHLIILGVVFVSFIIMANITPHITTTGLVDYPDWFYDYTILGFGTAMFALATIPLFFLIIWSIAWNKKIDAQVESLSKEEPHQD